MKTNRKKALIALVLGMAVFSAAAFADALIGSGYDNFKDSIKKTAAAMEKELDSYSAEFSVAIKVDGELFAEAKQINKTDNKNSAIEKMEFTNDKTRNKSYENYSYLDSECRITKNSDSGAYFVYKYDSQRHFVIVENPFNEKHSEDIEKIFDAAIGSLKNNVNMEENDGRKTFTGNIEETQIPALINAVASFAIKQTVMDINFAEEHKIPKVTKDIMIDSVSGKAVTNENGIITDAYLDIVFSGKDEGGAIHNAEINIKGRLYDINGTVVTKPDLTGKEVEYATERENSMFSNKTMGVYKNDIIIEKNDEFIKTGERFIVIESVENNIVTGKYYETYSDGYVPENKLEFSFSFDSGSYNGTFDYICGGESYKASLSTGMPGKIHISFFGDEYMKRTGSEAATVCVNASGEFSKVFD